MRITTIPLISGVFFLSVSGVVQAAPQVFGNLASVGMIGDANGDGIANSLDLQIVQQNLGKAGTLSKGDFDGNGLVDSNDLTLFNNNFQRRLPSAYFGKMVDTSTPIPSGSGNFSLLYAPSLDRQGSLAFLGTGPSNWGVYKWSGGVLTKAADNNTNIPNGTGQFTNFGQPSISSGKVAFEAVGNSQEGIYNFINGALTTVINKASARPEGGAYTAIGDPALVNTAVAFIGSGDTSTSAYTLSGAIASPVVSTTTPIPGGTGTFTSLTNAVSDGSNTWFVGRGIGQFGIYKKSGGVITTLLNRDTVIDGTSYKFTSGGNLSLDGQNLSFNGKFGGLQGVFGIVGSSINRIADTRTPVPGGQGLFSSFGMSSIGGSSVAFVGYDANSSPGIYAWVNGEIQRVIDASVMLNGKKISQLELSRNAVIDNKIVFQTIFGDGTSALYSASLLPTYLPGDVNNDGIVNSLDSNILQKNIGQVGGRSRGDLNGLSPSRTFNCSSEISADRARPSCPATPTATGRSIRSTLASFLPTTASTARPPRVISTTTAKSISAITRLSNRTSADRFP